MTTQGLKEYRQKLKMGLVETSIVLDPIEKAKHNPKSRRAAINSRCYNCSGFFRPDVTNCEMKDCPLFKHRPWKYDVKDIAVHQKDLNISEKASFDCKYDKDLESGQKPRLLNPYEKADQCPNSLKWAIRAYCYDCCCDQVPEVMHCTAVDCAFFNLRHWKAK